MNKNILIICYTFPPYPGVGGRRWAKFAKYLTRLGYTVHVVCAENTFDQKSNYTNDVSSNPNIKTYTFKPFYPHVLNVLPETLFDKIKYNFWVKVLPFIVKGYIYDKATFSEKKILRITEQVIKNYNIKNVIATGAPFRINYYSLKLKEKFPAINLINDIRDPWMWGDSYSYKQLSEGKKKYELSMQQSVITKSDVITVPVDVMRNYLLENNPAVSTQIYKLPHGFDEEDIVIKKGYKEKSFKLVFYGTLYSKIENYFDILSKHIAANKGKITLDVFSDSTKYKDTIQKNGAGNWVTYHDTLKGKELFKQLSTFDFVVFIHPDFGIDNISTKFYEIIYSKIPIIYIGKNGIASSFITDNNVGIHFTAEQLTANFQDFVDGKIKINYNTNYNAEEFSFTNVTKNLTTLFK